MKKAAALLAIAAIWGCAQADPKTGFVSGSDNYISVTQVAGSPRVNVQGANFHVEGTTLLDSTLAVTGASTFTGTVTLPAGTELPGSPTITTPTITTPVVTGLLTNTPQAFSIADDAAGTTPEGTLTPTSGIVLASCLDAHNCTVVMGETGMLSGMVVKIIGMTALTLAFADTAGVSETTGAITLGQYDSLSFVYATDRWVELGAVDN